MISLLDEFEVDYADRISENETGSRELLKVSVGGIAITVEFQVNILGISRIQKL